MSDNIRRNRIHAEIGNDGMQRLLNEATRLEIEARTHAHDVESLALQMADLAEKHMDAQSRFRQTADRAARAWEDYRRAVSGIDMPPRSHDR